MRASTLARFAVEAAFIVLVLVVAKLADLGTVGIILAGLFAWVLTAIAEGLVSRGWQGAATFVPPVRPFASPLEAREAAAPDWEPQATRPEEVAPAWLESAEILGVAIAGFEPAEEWADPAEPPEATAMEAEEEPEALAGEEEAVGPREEEAAVLAEEEPPGEVVRPRRVARSRLPQRFVTQSGRARRAPTPAAEPPVTEEEPEVAAAAEVPTAQPEPEPKPWPPPERRWPWRRARGEPDRERRPAPERREEEQPELPIFEVPERLCRSCGQPITKERLRAIPNATQCIDCKRSGRPELADIADFEIPEEEEVFVVEAEAEPVGEVAPVESEPEAPAEPEPEPEAPVEVEPEPSPVVSEEPAQMPEPIVISPPEPKPEPGPDQVARVPFSVDTREWNVWELERLARRVGGMDAARDEEWAFLLVYLREFANPEGLLPADFDALVRESFPELVSAAETS